uniref:Nucleolar protein 10 n=1 Tax=Kalanchoe fedtschenkoi TaxID=63787 RepID=A0A7N0UV27_KALFE
MVNFSLHQMKVYELKELALKFERHLISEIVDFQILSEDYSKIAFMCADRSICLHAKYGSHYSLRIPRMGRDLEYDCWSCDLLCAASSPDLYRINLEQGRFLSPLSTQSPALNVVSRSKVHGLVACGGEDGAVECFDMRTRQSVGRLDTLASSGDVDQEVTALGFEGDYSMAVGSSGGKVLLYDLRSSLPVRVKDHMYGSPIIDIKWNRTVNSHHPKMITTDSHVVRIWDPETGEAMSSIEPTAGKINDICVFKDTGLILLALDNSQIPSYFLPALGPAPKWCSYLENLTEEMEEGSQTTIYDDFKFLTREELEKLNMTQLIGTNLLRAYMHGFFVDYRLYKKAKALVDPFAYEAYIEQRKREKLEAERQSRITIKRKLPKVNRPLVESILETEYAENGKKDDNADVIKKSKKKKGLSSEVFKDERFNVLFEDKDYEVDPESYEYKVLHPVASKKPTSLVDEHFDPVMEDENRYFSDSDGSQPHSSDDEGGDKRNKPSRVPMLYEVKDEKHLEAYWNNQSLAEEEALTMEERAQALQAKASAVQGVKFGAGGSREITFVPKRKSKYDVDEDEQENGREDRRGIKSLRMNQDGSDFSGRGRGRGGRGNRGGGRGGGRGRSRGGGRGGGGSRGRGRGRK